MQKQSKLKEPLREDQLDLTDPQAEEIKKMLGMQSFVLVALREPDELLSYIEIHGSYAALHIFKALANQLRSILSTTPPEMRKAFSDALQDMLEK